MLEMDENVDELISQLRSPFNYDNPDLQWETCIKLGELGKTVSNIQTKQRIIDSLIDVINPKNCAATRAQAVLVLGNLGSKKPIDKLKSSLRDPYGLVRAYSIKALRRLNDESAIYALIDYLKNPKEFHGSRLEAAAAIRAICENKVSYDCEVAWQALDEVHLESDRDKDKPDIDPETKNILIRLWNETKR
jgi:hypothetical protein